MTETKRRRIPGSVTGMAYGLALMVIAGLGGVTVGGNTGLGFLGFLGLVILGWSFGVWRMDRRDRRAQQN